MSITIEKAHPTDISDLINMLREFAAYEDLLEYCNVTEERLRGALFGDGSFVNCLIAHRRGEPAGYAFYYPSYASFRGQQGFYLEDIFVRDGFRGQGVGDQLLRTIAREAKLRGFERIDFQVLIWNTPAIKFYNKHGAVSNEDERHFKFADAAFEALAR